MKKILFVINLADIPPLILSNGYSLRARIKRYQIEDHNNGKSLIKREGPYISIQVYSPKGKLINSMRFDPRDAWVVINTIVRAKNLCEKFK